MLFCKLNLITVFPDGVYPQRVPGVAGFVTQRTLMTEAADVRLDMLLHRVSQLGAVVALGTLPHCLA